MKTVTATPPPSYHYYRTRYRLGGVSALFRLALRIAVLLLLAQAATETFLSLAACEQRIEHHERQVSALDGR